MVVNTGKTEKKKTITHSPNGQTTAKYCNLSLAETAQYTVGD